MYGGRGWHVGGGTLKKQLVNKQVHATRESVWHEKNCAAFSGSDKVGHRGEKAWENGLHTHAHTDTHTHAAVGLRFGLSWGQG